MDDEQYQHQLTDFEQQAPTNSHEFQTGKPPKFSRKRIILVVLGFLLIGGLGFGLAIYQENKSNEPTKLTIQNTQNTQTAQPSVVSDVPVVGTTKSFKTDFPRIELTYPENWKVTASTEQEGVRVESPDFSYTSINGGQITGNFRIYIRQGARPQDSKYIGRGVAAKQTEKLAYSSPPAGQRPETNLSFFGLDTSDNFAYFLIAGNFSLQKGETLGPDYGKEAETYIITGGYSSTELSDDMATNPVPIEYFDTTNAYQQAIEILKSLKLL